jgi:hypothetical protein
MKGMGTCKSPDYHHTKEYCRYKNAQCFLEVAALMNGELLNYANEK